MFQVSCKPLVLCYAKHSYRLGIVDEDCSQIGVSIMSYVPSELQTTSTVIIMLSRSEVVHDKLHENCSQIDINYH